MNDQKIYVYYGRNVRIPKGYNWIAIDEDGRCYAYNEEPSFEELTGMWDVPLGRMTPIKMVQCSFIDWRKTLRKVSELTCCKQILIDANSSAIVSVEQLKAMLENAPEDWGVEVDRIASMCGYDSRSESIEQEFDTHQFCELDYAYQLEVLSQWQPLTIKGWELVHKFLDDTNESVPTAFYVRPKEVRE